LLKWEAAGTGETRYLIKNGQRIGITKYPLETSRQAEFDQILSTFKFVEQATPTPNQRATQTGVFGCYTTTVHDC
jgi:hypothetical protein